MIFYKNKRNDDPYIELWSRKEWLDPIENADSMDFPLIITVEPTNACQNKCLYCSRQLMDRKIGYMTLENLELIAKEAGENNAAIRHGGFGEPLLHPKIVDIIEICKKYNVLTTIFTNCNLLTEDMMGAFVDLGLDEIRFSSSGITHEEHNRIRRNSDYHRDFDEKLTMAYEVREKMNATRPFLTLYTNVIDYNNDIFEKNIESYKQKYLKYADKIDIDLTMFSRVKNLDHVKNLYKDQKVEEVHKKCVTLFLKFIVHWNGDTFACDRVYNYDGEYYLGAVGRDGFTINEGYHSTKMQKLRDNLSFDMKHNDFTLCQDCYSNTTKWELKE
jgi:wyosine [tRNA(Phe)-imidazoG37] synthetase (radical SAM superfamily)